MDYRIAISPKMAAVHEIMLSECPGIGCCLYEKGRNLTVEVSKTDCEQVIATLKKHYQDVVHVRKTYAMIEDLHGFILVKPMISESPLTEENGIPVPELEKELVDMVSDKDFGYMNGREKDCAFQHAFETYPVNTARLLRYAGRKGKKEEIRKRLESLDRQRIETIKKLQEQLEGCPPVLKAWLFGSYARMEERTDSDVDILVRLDPELPMGLLAFSDLIGKLETISGRPVDLVAEGSVKPFALETINRDKTLIYERSIQR